MLAALIKLYEVNEVDEMNEVNAGIGIKRRS